MDITQHVSLGCDCLFKSVGSPCIYIRKCYLTVSTGCKFLILSGKLCLVIYRSEYERSTCKTLIGKIAIIIHLDLLYGEFTGRLLLIIDGKSRIRRVNGYYRYRYSLRCHRIVSLHYEHVVIRIGYIACRRIYLLYRIVLIYLKCPPLFTVITVE